jgi:hypothetical protein
MRGGGDVAFSGLRIARVWFDLQLWIPAFAGMSGRV